MVLEHGPGNFIANNFVPGGSIEIISKNPSTNFEAVYKINTSLDHIDQAVQAARMAYPNWVALTQLQRNNYFYKLKEIFKSKEHEIAQAISLEMGKIFSEALLEAKSLSARIDLILNYGLGRVSQKNIFALRAQERHHAQGVLSIIGPYNFPAHLINAHAIPSLLTGNTIIIKPSEVCPKVADLYAQCFYQAGFPSGVVNLIHGDKIISQNLVMHKDTDGVLFTGSYPTGRIIQELLLDQPHKILALELGGKNFAVVCEDADINQAVLEIIMGAYLTTGQRCTATSRVLVHKNIYEKTKNLLLDLAKNIKPGDFFGPLATQASKNNFAHKLAYARENNAKVLLESEFLPASAFVTPSIYEISSDHKLDNYLGEELFGPNIALEIFATHEQAAARINQSPYGLSNSVFSLNHNNLEFFYNNCKSGIINFNRSTNGASGRLPFGGINKSGNQRPAGIDAVRYTTFPVAYTELSYGESQAPNWLKNKLPNINNPNIIPNLINSHRLEIIFEIFGIYPDFISQNKIIFNQDSFTGLQNNKIRFMQELEQINNLEIKISHNLIIFDSNNLDQEIYDQIKFLLEKYSQLSNLQINNFNFNKISIPTGLELTRSRNFLDRLYKNNFVPKEKKAPVIDLYHSRGAYLASIDSDPLVLFDAASQIATIGAGFSADIFQNSYDNCDFDINLITNYDLSTQNHNSQDENFNNALKTKSNFENFLQQKAGFEIKSFAYGAGGAEANEIAFDLCRQNGPGGKKIIAFEGAFHGRTLMSLHATANKTKRTLFEFAGYEAAFLPFPILENPQNQPDFDADLIKNIHMGNIPQISNNNNLLEQELTCLAKLKEEVLNNKILCVIIEPMQCEGGDRYASNRFFNMLRAYTRFLKIPLVFDEVQTGFNLGRSFFWHSQFNLRDYKNNIEYPDCVTLAKRAQLGVCLSVFDNSRSYSPHIIQLQRGLLHAQAIGSGKAIELEKLVLRELERLQNYFPNLVFNFRACGFAFAFDMPSQELAFKIINQRFERGFMAYIAGERTLRFRLNMSWDINLILRLFEKLFLALSDLQNNQVVTQIKFEPTQYPQDKFVINNLKYEKLDTKNFNRHKKQIEILENQTYEKGRRDSLDTLKIYIEHQDSVGIIVLGEINNSQKLLGYAIGGPLELAHAQGAQEDPNFGKNNTYYSADITLDKQARGHGIGTNLKAEQIKLVSLVKNSDGSPRYLFITGRNRVGKANAMTKINSNLGAYIINIFDNQYGEPGAQAIYYRLNLYKTKHQLKFTAKNNINNNINNNIFDCRNIIEQAFSKTPKNLLTSLEENNFRIFSTTKLTLSNWATPNLIRYSELLQNLLPAKLNHCYFTSGRNEIVDKGIRSLKFYRQEADIIIGFSHQWLGSITAAARSLSHPQDQKKPFEFFDWPKVTHPAIIGEEASFAELEKIISQIPHKKILGLVVELMGERSGFCFSESYLAKLDKIREQSGIPIIFVETASALLRNSKSIFYSESLNITPNMIWWFTGGQLGHIFVDSKYFVEKPLTLISTWDGDDISILRSYHNLIHANNIKSKINKNFAQEIKNISKLYKSHGQGFWHSFNLDSSIKLQKAQELGRKNNLLFGAGFDNNLMVCPRPDSSDHELDKILDTLEKIFKNL